VVMRSPTTAYRAEQLSNGNLPALSRPRTTIAAWDGNWVPDLYLPTSTPAGYRVVVTSHASFSITVHGLQNDNNNTVTVRNGDIIAFKVDPQGLWQQETVIIDILLLYSDKAAAQMGEAQERARLIEGFDLTNEALENSGANFRLRRVGLEMIVAPDHWTALIDPLSELRSDPAVQARRDQLGADAIYYEGTEAGCGLAWVRASAFNMVGTGSLNCGTTVMRHEFGHNMGLNHGVATDYNGGDYAVGNSRVATVMGGNAIPYYATPWRYTEKHGISLGVIGQIDAVRAMNEFSATVAAYR